MSSESLQRLPSLIRVVDGVEFLGRYDGSGYQGEQYLIRRPDGQLLRLSQLLYLVLEAVAASSSLAEAAAHVTTSLRRDVTAENISYLIENQLGQLGVFDDAAGPGDAAADTPPVPAGSPRPAARAFALRFRRPLLPARAHLRATRALERLFDARVVGVVLVALAAADAWLLATGGGRVLAGATQTLDHPLLLLFLIGAFCASNVFHEFGHAAATTYGGATPGPMGVGIYIALPVFYTDVTDSYRLSRRSRLRVDLGGVYFNALTAALVSALYLATAFRPLLLFAVLVQMEALVQFLPFLRLDGYYVVADLIGVPDPFAFVRPVLARFLGRPAPSTSPNLALLTTKARRAITGWCCSPSPSWPRKPC